MFKRIFLAVALTVALAVPAFAQNSGFYLGLKFIDSIQSTGNVSTSKGANLFDTGEYSQNTVGGGAFVGYDFYPANDIPLRTEIEYAIRTNSETDWDGKHGLDATLKGRWNLQTLFLNLYWDFHNDTAFTPYIGGGLGMGFIESRYKVEGLGYSGSSTDYNTVFAWNAGAGVSYAFTDTISADLAYRFVGLSYYEHEKSFGGQKAKVGMAPYANEFSLGVRFTF
ncbi:MULTISPECIES: outer membrane protein [unclassified Desulfovibrio]|uniref:outer membrane protein n=1 Tax=unclassified Desulfovibrio TaxID=2593640 RepID=UPI002FDAC7D9